MGVFIKGMNSKINDSLKKGIEKFVRTSYRELVDAGYHSLLYTIKIKNNTVCIYLQYDLDPEDSEMILSWHIYLQTKLNKIVKKIDLEPFDNVVFIIESKDLWDKD